MIEIATKNTVAEPVGTIILKKNQPILLYYKNVSLTLKKKTTKKLIIVKRQQVSISSHGYNIISPLEISMTMYIFLMRQATLSLSILSSLSNFNTYSNCLIFTIYSWYHVWKIYFFANMNIYWSNWFSIQISDLHLLTHKPSVIFFWKFQKPLKGIFWVI